MENLNEMLYKYKANINDHIVENYIQEPQQMIKNKKSIYSFDTETSKREIVENKYECITYATMYMSLDDDTNTCYMNRSLDDFLINAENNSDRQSIYYAHNGSGFDYKNLLHTLIKHGYKILDKEYIKSVFSTYEISKFIKRDNLDMSKTIDIKYKDGKIYEMTCIAKTVYLIPSGRGKSVKYKELSIDEVKKQYENLEKIKKYRVDKKLIFRDSMLLLTGTLEKLCADNFNLYLPKEDLDYEIFRDKNTRLTNNEYFYCYADVFGLKYLIKNVLYKEYEFNYLSYNKNSECFIYNTESLKEQYNFAESIKNRFKYLEVNTESVQDRFDISDLKIKLADKLTSASYSFYILKRFIHYEVCKSLVFLLNNPKEIKTEFQKYLLRSYLNNYEKRRLKLKDNEKIKFTSEDSYRLIFPKLNKIVDNDNKINATWFIKGAYHGGRCFTGKNFYNMYRKGKFNTYYRGNGTTIDANSLYPTQMRYKDMPYGYYEVIENETFGNNEDFYLNNRITFIKFKTSGRVTLKQGKFPMQRVTNTICEGFKGSESFVTNVRNVNGIKIPISMNLTLNSIDYKNFFDSYNVISCNINKVLSFRKTKGLFNSFIDYFYEIKKNGKGTMRNNAKLVLNSAYGKFGTKPISNDYEIFLNDNGIMEYSKKYIVYDEEGKETFSSQARLNNNSNIEELKLVEEPFYMPIATVVTAEGRNDLKYVSEKLGMENFLYCDTDSWHGRLTKKQIINKLGNLIDDKDLGKWAIEGEFIEGQYLGAKRYAEYVFNPKEDKYEWDIKCCGIPDKTRKKIVENISTFNYCNLTQKEFKKLYNSNKLVIVNNNGNVDNNGYLYKNIETNEIINGAYVVNKSKESVNGVCILKQPYLITKELYLNGSDID